MICVRHKARIAFGVALLCLLLAPGSAWAQRVLLLRPPGDDSTLSEAFNRLRAELILQDFDVAVLDATAANVLPTVLEQEAQRAGAFAGISLTRGQNGATADVCIADRVTGKTSQRRLAIDDSQEAPRVLAVRAVDLLRASLSELPSGERPPSDVVGVQPEAAAPQLQDWATPPARWQLRAAGIALGPLSPLGPSWGGAVALLYRPTPRLGVGVLVAGPLLGAQFEAPLGTASVRQEFGLALLFWNVLPHSRWQLGPLLAAGAYHLHAQGEVAEPLLSRSDGVWSFAASGGFEAELHLTSSLRLAASLSGLFLSPQPVVAVEASTQALAEPLLLASMGLGVAF